VRKLQEQWTCRFDAILEKGVLDAVYLSGDGNVEQAVENLHRVLKPGGLHRVLNPGGIFVSVSGVVPEDLRRSLFRNWTWRRDDSNDLQAGCFVFQKEE
jgi:SAM-dependent methyltransferase